MPRLPRITPGRLCGLMALALVALGGWSLISQTGLVTGLQAMLTQPDSDSTALALHFAWWPRLAMALLAGAALALAGVLFQQVLRNPLAAPTTLGVTSGAELALLAATLLAPGLLAAGREWVALAGGGLAMGLVFLLTWHRGLTPVVVVLAGLVVNLYFAALADVLLLFHHEELKGLLIWGAGSLAQNGWVDVITLLPQLAAGAIAAWLLLRPLAALELDDASARGLGLSVRALRAGGLAVGVFLTACVVSVAGVVAFIGLAAPNIVRLAGARRLGPRLVWSTLLGALLLAVTDQVLQPLAERMGGFVPTGAATALLGAPLLLWLIPRLKLGSSPPTPGGAGLGHRALNPGRRAAVLGAGLIVATVLGLCLGRTGGGWALVLTDWDILQWRVPRVLAAAASGAMLALAGTMIQRVTANPMASPEILGISGGSAIAVIGGIFLIPGASNSALVGLGTLGALAALLVLIGLNRANGYLPERLLLTGVAVTALYHGVRTLALAGGDPRGQQALAWLSGSVYYVDIPGALTVTAAAVVLAVAAAPFARWLDIMPLGPTTAGALGLGVDRARLVLLLLVALLTATATLVVGPLSFVGLLAPHMARMLGFNRAGGHMAGAALLGAGLMVIADWSGRQLLFPQEIPAGLMASLLGGAYFLWQLRRF